MLALLEVLALELGALIDDQVLWSDSLCKHDLCQGSRHFLGRRSALEDGESHATTRIVINHVQ
jgi:hypothetical protein